MSGFQHQKLIVYGKALRLAANVYALTLRLPSVYRPIALQLQRAVTSLLLNIAEGAGEFSADDKARFYRLARRSAAEVAAALDLRAALGAIQSDANVTAQAALDEIAAMLTSMVSARTGTRSIRANW